jgi:hypothetical protein
MSLGASEWSGDFPAGTRTQFQIVAQLPETQADALLILEVARDFVLRFLADDEVEEVQLPGLVDRARECVVLTLVPAALALASAASSVSADLSV